MKITLVLCPSWGIETPHLGIALLVANLRRHGYQVQVRDFNIRIHQRDKAKGLWKSEEDVHWEDEASLHRFIRDNDEVLNSFVEETLATGAEVIGFSVYNTTKRLSLELARRIKQRDKSKIIICGGQMCFPKPAAESIIRESAVDAVVMGEGDEVIVNLMEKITELGKPGPCPGVFYKDKGEIIDCGMAVPIMNMDNLPYPDFSDFDLKLYENPAQLPLLSGRGCPYQCAFCNTKLFWIKYRSMSGDRIFQEVLYQLNKYEDVIFFTFNDHTVNANMRALSRFVELAIELKTKRGKERRNYAGLNWRGAAVIREEMDKDFINKLKLSGCIELEFGIESASDRVRRLMRKPPDDIKVVQRVIKDTTEAGIGVRANFMFGFPGETEEDFQETLEFLKRNKDYFVQVHPSETFCHIDPDTYMYNHPEEFGVTNYKGNSLYWESIDGKNIYPGRLRRHLIFCQLANSLKIPLSPGGHKILLHKQHFIDEYSRYLENKKKGENRIVVDSIVEERAQSSESDEADRVKQCTPIRFNWVIHYKCDYLCPYCDFYGQWDKLTKINEYSSSDGWIEAWHRIYQRYGTCVIEVTGGEPFLYPSFSGLLRGLLKEHRLQIYTNLPNSKETYMKLFDDLDSNGLSIWARYHPLFADYNSFLEKMLFLKEKEIPFKIFCVAYPPQLILLRHFQERFRNNGIDFLLLPFQGEFQGISYPAGYTENDKGILATSLEFFDQQVKKWIENYRLSRKGKNKLCKMGQVSGYIEPDGKVYRCCMFKSVQGYLGNLFDKNFQLLNESTACSIEYCPFENKWSIGKLC